MTQALPRPPKHDVPADEESLNVKLSDDSPAAEDRHAEKVFPPQQRLSHAVMRGMQTEASD